MRNLLYTPNEDTSHAGFALFYAVVVVAVISSLGAVLSSLIVREADLTATARQSSRAYYSADAGIECAQYWDLQENHFPRGSAQDEGNITCVGQSIGVTASTFNGDDQRYEFSIDNSNICADVVVEKTESGSRNITRINSYGSDTCTTNNRIERALRTTY